MYDLPDSTVTGREKKKSSAPAGLPSPRGSARLCQERLQELRATLPSARRGDAPSHQDEAMQGSGIDGASFLDDKKVVGTGAVYIDPPLRSQFGVSQDQSNVYAEWQLQRQAMSAPSPPLKPLPGDAMLAHMGLFNRLPGELRNRIYRLALLDPEGPYTITMEPGTCSMGPCVHAKLPTAIPGILSTCRQIRQEGFIIFCAENSAIKFDHHTVRNRCTANWLRAIGPYASKTPKFILEVVVWQSVNGTHNREGVGQSKEIVLECPSNTAIPRFQVEFDSSISAKEPKLYEKLQKHLEKLNDRIGKVGNEELLLEWVWSDLLADLVWRCQKW